MGFKNELKKATAHTKIMNFTSSIVSLFVFFKARLVLIPVGLVMGIGQIIGAYIGSTLVAIRGNKFVRIFLLFVIAFSIARLIYMTYFT